MADPVNDYALDTIWRKARTRNGWKDKNVPETLIRATYDLAKMGATSANCSPARFVFIQSQQAKERLKPHLTEGNVAKTMSAPWTVIIAHDMNFHERIPELFPHNPGAKDWFTNDDFRAETAMRNGSLQGAYLMLAARSLGLDCGPMSGFDKDGVDEEFFKNDSEMGAWRSNFLINVGYGTTEKLFPRLPKLAFEQGAKLLK